MTHFTDALSSMARKDMSGCFVCRLRRKKCGGPLQTGQCGHCVELNIQCLRGYGHPVPPRLRDPKLIRLIGRHTRRLANRRGSPLRLEDYVAASPSKNVARLHETSNPSANRIESALPKHVTSTRGVPPLIDPSPHVVSSKPFPRPPGAPQHSPTSSDGESRCPAYVQSRLLEWNLPDVLTFANPGVSGILPPSVPADGGCLPVALFPIARHVEQFPSGLVLPDISDAVLLSTHWSSGMREDPGPPLYPQQSPFGPFNNPCDRGSMIPDDYRGFVSNSEPHGQAHPDLYAMTSSGEHCLGTTPRDNDVPDANKHIGRESGPSSKVLDEGSYPRRRADPALQHPEGRPLDPSSTNQTATVLQEPRVRSDGSWSTVDWQAEFLDIRRSGHPFTASLGTPLMQRANTSGGYRSYHDLAGASSSAPLPIPSDLGAPLGWLAAYSLDVMNTVDPGDSSPQAYVGGVVNSE